jgi:transglutaminase-like putative cysteine protease
MRLSIRHTTHYHFDQPVAHGLQRLRLTPKSTHGQQVLEWRMDLTGATFEAEYDDQHHNRTTLVSLNPGVSDVTITCTGMVGTADNAGVLGAHSGHMPMWAFLKQTDLTRPGAKMRALVAELDGDKGNTLTQLHALSTAVLAAMTYEIGSTGVNTTGEAALAAGHGVCQDHAHVFIGCARLRGVPARYVSGYLMMDDRIDQEAGHAWVEAHVDGLGWVGFDVSNGISPDARYVRVATGCDYRDAAPVTGISFGAGESALRVSLEVEQQLAEQ